MKKKAGWIMNSSIDMENYDFVFDNFPKDDVEKEIKKTLELIEKLSQGSQADVLEGWLALIRKFPKEILQVLIFELRSGSQLVNISYGNWPTIGSVVARINGSFSISKKKLLSDVIWRKINDPHYCQEEVSQNKNGVEYLIIY